MQNFVCITPEISVKLNNYIYNKPTYLYTVATTLNTTTISTEVGNEGQYTEQWLYIFFRYDKNDINSNCKAMVHPWIIVSKSTIYYQSRWK